MARAEGPQPVEPRVGRAERDAVLDRLREALAEDRLTHDEFEERAERALQARTASQLEPLTADLPASTAPVPASVAARRAQPPARILSGRVARIAAGTAAVVALGLGVSGGGFEGFAVMGGDEVRVLAPGDSVDALAVMGGVEVVVPDGTSVDQGGVAVMGGISCDACDAPTAPGAGTVEVDAWALMGGVDIKTASQAAQDNADEGPGD